MYITVQVRPLGIDRGQLSRHYLKGKWNVIGRGADCALRIQCMESSRIHAVLFEGTSGCLYVKDLSSRNGVRLNGEKVSLSPLRVGDRITIGEVEINLLSYTSAKLERKTGSHFGTKNPDVVHRWPDIMNCAPKRLQSDWAVLNLAKVENK